MPKLKPVKRNNISEQVYNSVLDQIIREEWRAGEKIPSENELKQLFGVSRNTVRGAISRLNSLGVLDTRVGEGTYVKKIGSDVYFTKLSSAIVLDKSDYLEIMQLRMGIEVEAIRLAAEHATDEDISALEKIIDGHKNNVNNYPIAAKEDIAFHVMCSKISGNKLMYKIMELIKHLLLVRLNIFIYKDRQSSNSIYYHIKMFEAIKARDPILAADVMHEHLTKIILRMKEIYQNNDSEKTAELDESLIPPMSGWAVEEGVQLNI